MVPSTGPHDEEPKLKDKSPEEIDEEDADSGSDIFKEGFMHSVIEAKEDTIEEGKLVNDAMNKGINGFTPSLVMQKLVSNFQNAKQVMGEKLLRAATDYDLDYIERNIKIPEFQSALKDSLNKKFKKLKEQGIVDHEGRFTEKALKISAIALYMDQLEHMKPKGMYGEYKTPKKSIYGDKEGTRKYRKGDRFRDISLRKTMLNTIRKGHDSVTYDDLVVSERVDKGKITMVYAIDASGSMKGEKLEAAKRAGIALSFNAIENLDKVGLLVFGAEIKNEIYPTKDFLKILYAINKIKASAQTDMASTIVRAKYLFSESTGTKHLLLLTDALPTTGDQPEEDTLNAVREAAASDITISLAGIKLENKGMELAKKIVEIGKGKLYVMKSLDDLDRVVLEDYYGL